MSKTQQIVGEATYQISGKLFQVDLKGSPLFTYGEPVVLSTPDTDITWGQEWYDRGYESIELLKPGEFEALKEGVTASIKRIVSRYQGELTNFDLSKYHRLIGEDLLHYQVVSETRDLFPEDFNFPIEEMYPRLGELLGFKLTDTEPDSGKKVHIIVRINRPGSSDYNPPHKDIYEGVDNNSRIPQIVNFWLPIVGVTQNSSLPMVPHSHRIPESKILRTFEGGIVAGKKYRVRAIKEWDGSNELTRVDTKDGQVLVFSSHLIHGLAINEEPDTTRVSLEFRLFKEAG